MPRMLSFGSTGPLVVGLQKSLNLLPTDLEPLKPDGIFGSRTRGRVQEFQDSNDLDTDGVVGPLTWGQIVGLFEETVPTISWSLSDDTDGLGVMVRDSGHVIALDTAAMATAATGRPHRRKERIPPGPAAKAAAAQLIQIKQADSSADQSCTPSTDSTVIDLSAYERAAQKRTLQ